MQFFSHDIAQFLGYFSYSFDTLILCLSGQPPWKHVGDRDSVGQGGQHCGLNPEATQAAPLTERISWLLRYMGSVSQPNVPSPPSFLTVDFFRLSDHPHPNRAFVASRIRNVSGGTIRGLIGGRHNSAVAFDGPPGTNFVSVRTVKICSIAHGPPNVHCSAKHRPTTSPPPFV